MPETLFLAGPTASGKSSVALVLADLTGGEIVNADAFQLYRGLPVITAQPSPEDRKVVPHHLYAVLELSETCDAARYADMARPVIRDILARGKRPVVVGGSGLYLKALTHGLSDLPRADAALRAAWEAMPAEELLELLRRHDPHSWETIDRQNMRYVIRALEISVLTGRPASELRTAWRDQPVDFTGFVLVRDRLDLHRRINDRVVAMREQGAVGEAMRAGEVAGTGGKAIGLSEWRAAGEGRIPVEQAVDLIQAATRQYARRQLTWFRREKGFVPISVEPGDDAVTVASRILNFPSPDPHA